MAKRKPAKPVKRLEGCMKCGCPKLHALGTLPYDRLRVRCSACNQVQIKRTDTERG